MPTTPQVRFNFKNLNVQPSVPLLGVINVVAVTTKGPFNDPSTIISSVPKFVEKYGSEVVPDGSVSNIIKALEMGAKVRVSRVEGANAQYGFAKNSQATGGFSVEADIQNAPDIANQGLVYLAFDSSDAIGEAGIVLSIRTREKGSPLVGDNPSVLSTLAFDMETIGNTTRVYLNQYVGPGVTTDGLVNRSLVMEYTSQSGSVPGSKTTFNTNVLRNFLESNNPITLDYVGFTGGTDPGYALTKDMMKGMSNMDDVLNLLDSDIYTPDLTLKAHVGQSYESPDIYIFNQETKVTFSITPGSVGDTPTSEDWQKAYKELRDYTEAYMLILSHVHQHLSGSELNEVYTTVANDVTAKFEQVFAVEVPKDTDENTVFTNLKTLVNKIGPKKSVAYFGGGIKYYNSRGVLQNCDVLGTVAGLQAKNASTFGPWYSFSGMNRGVVFDALGPVMKNLGTPSNLERLQDFADWYMNLFVVKDTPTMGKRTMLWHGFTSNPINDSEKFISVVMLNLYLKKNLRPILESAIEEPNTFDTWKAIYYKAKDILDDLRERNALTSYVWMGDQNATSYEELQVNNEADVRQGKYHIILKFKEIVPLQDIEMDVVMDIAMNRSTGEINISTNL